MLSRFSLTLSNLARLFAGITFLATSLAFGAEPEERAAAEKPAPKMPPAAERKLDFVRDIEPIFEARCNYCHGEEKQEGRLRLDARAIVLRGGKSGPLFHKGKSAESLLIGRLIGLGTEKQMPLDDDPLSDEEIGLIRAWIDQGAAWPDGIGSKATEIPKHWAYVAPQRPQLPNVKAIDWRRNAVDAFILARLEKEKLAPSPPSERPQLIRRVSLDLIGLPPTIEEVEAFVADQSPDAYERLIDRLLASPRYGERWATPWLDAARYADSNGFQRDGHRSVWAYRDWVIRALNADMPFDQFTIEQIAGDLLPGSTHEQKIATGFHRCTTVNVEAGVDQEENRTNQVIDRVNVTGTVWLGTTLECCQCHDHKYDPFTQRDYYSLMAYFNNTAIETEQQNKGAAALNFIGPELTLPEQEESAARRRKLQQEQKALTQDLAKLAADEASGLPAWELELKENAEKKKALPVAIARALKVQPENRNKRQNDLLMARFVSESPEAKEIQAKIDALKKEIDALAPPASLVMVEMDEPRMTAIFERGSFLSPGETVQPGTPRTLHELPQDAPPNRLGLAEWLVDPRNPLVARVTVNRAWAQFFGQGIVLSEEDFGTQCEPPTHRELLDHLAVEFVASGWSLKDVHRAIVTSSTYQQASKVSPQLLRRDPYNRLYARGPRLRMTAEQIRDNALAVSGRLASKLHGPPVYPPQPAGIWRVTGNVDNTYRTSTGEDRYRRGLYTVQRRSAPYPSFLNFDATDRSACVVKRTRSNTPLQALTLLNDPVYVELAAALADRVALEPISNDIDTKLQFAFRSCLSRSPRESELASLREIFDGALARYEADAKAARAVLGKHELPADCDAATWAAWFSVAQVLLNLDETITK